MYVPLLSWGPRAKCPPPYPTPFLATLISEDNSMYLLFQLHHHFFIILFFFFQSLQFLSRKIFSCCCLNYSSLIILFAPFFLLLIGITVLLTYGRLYGKDWIMLSIGYSDFSSFLSLSINWNDPDKNLAFVY